jgi:hypothetical protein
MLLAIVLVYGVTGLSRGRATRPAHGAAAQPGN